MDKIKISPYLLRRCIDNELCLRGDAVLGDRMRIVVNEIERYINEKFNLRDVSPVDSQTDTPEIG